MTVRPAIREPASGTRLTPATDAELCGCGCGESARAGGDFVDWGHYARWKRNDLERIAREARPLYEGGMTLDEIQEARPDLPRHRVYNAFRTFGVPMRRRGKRLGRRSAGDFVKCAARGFEWCPHGETERWVYTSDAAGRRAEFLSKECWARYRAVRERRTLLPFVSVAVKTSWTAQSRRSWGGLRGAIEKGGRPAGKLSEWTEKALPTIEAARRALERELGRQPSLRELEERTGVPRSTLARLSH